MWQVSRRGKGALKWRVWLVHGPRLGWLRSETYMEFDGSAALSFGHSSFDENMFSYM